MEINYGELQKYVDSRAIIRVDHSEFPISIYKYGVATQYSGNWNKYTLKARGLILDNKGNIIARPLPKFFNHTQVINTLQEVDGFFEYDLELTEKIDGSLGILYFWEENAYIATPCSFNSSQAIWATQWINKNVDISLINREYTYLFEIIYPNNQIIVDYGTKETLVLLAAINMQEEGKELDIYLEGAKLGLPTPARQVIKAPFSYKTLEEIGKLNLSNAEGFVGKSLNPNNPYRLKIKFDNYLKKHKFKFSVNPKTLKELLLSRFESEGKLYLLDEELELIPDEYYNSIKEVERRVEEIREFVLRVFGDLHSLSQKEFAKVVLENYSDYSPIFFQLKKNVNQRRLRELICKKIRKEEKL